MSATARIEVVGVKNTINQLGKLDKELQKQFKADATQIADPAISAAKAVYTKVPLSGMSRAWKSHKRTPPQNVKGFSAAKAVYTKVPLSGMKYKWQQKGRTRANFPFTVAKAKAGVQMKFDTRRNAVGVILIIQKDPAAAIFETAGRANPNKLNTSLMFVGMPVTAGRTRLIGPAVYRARRGIETEMKSVIAKASRTVQRGL